MDQPPTPSSGLGEYLRAEREKKMITIKQVASATKVSIKLLHALENDNYDALPAKPFVRGFVTSYARYLGLDSGSVLSRFDLFLDEKSGKKFKYPSGAPHIFVGDEGQSDNSKTILSIVMVSFVVVALVGYAILKPSLKHHQHHKDKAVTNEEIITVVPPPSEDTAGLAPSSPEPETAPAVQQAAPVAPAITPVAVTAPESAPVRLAPPASSSKQADIPTNEIKYRLVIRADDDAWVHYQSDDRKIQAYTLHEDKVIFINARHSIRFTTANPKAIEYSFDNKEFHPMDPNLRVMVIPSSEESKYKDQPFIPPADPKLSTGNP